MKNILVYLFLLLVINLLSCKKHQPYVGEYEVNGRVLDEITGKPIPYATVGVLAKRRSDFSGWGAKTGVSGYADGNGWFSLRFDVREEDYHYELVAKEQHRYFDNSNYGLISIYKKGKTTMDVTLMPYGYLTFDIRGNKGGEYISIGYYRFRNGIDTTVTFHKEPNKKTKIHYSVYDGVGSSTIFGDLIHRDSIVTTTPLPPDTAYYLIEF